MRKMRRQDRQLSAVQAWELLKAGRLAVLCTVGEDGQPYGVPLHYAVDGNVAYFHSAPAGHKLNNVRANPRVSLTVIVDYAYIPDQFATAYRSVIAWGTAKVADEKDKRVGLELLMDKYCPEHRLAGREYIEREWDNTVVIRMDIEGITGKASPG